MTILSFFSTRNRKIAGWLLAIVGTFFIVAAKYQKVVLKPIYAQESTYKVVIFDLGEVLFSTSSSAKHSIIVPTIFKNPSLLYYLIGFQVKEEFFKLLHQVPAKTNSTMYHQAKSMPQIMVDWQTGASNCHEIKTAVQHQIKQSAYPAAIKELFKAVAHLMFDPKTLASSQTPIQPMVRLATELKKAGYKLFALSNWDPESFEILQQTHPKIFDLFDGILISGQEKIGKPTLEFYTRLMQNHNLNSNECIFIDDETYNIQAAQQLGITTIYCDKTSTVIKELINLGIIILQP